METETEDMSAGGRQEGATRGAAPDPNLLWRIVDGEALLLDARTGDYFWLDPLGTEIWQRLHRGEAVHQIASTIARRYVVDPTRVRRDVDELIAELHDARLLT